MPLFYLSGIYKQSLNLTNLKKDALKLLCLRIINIEILLGWVSVWSVPHHPVSKAVVELAHNITAQVQAYVERVLKFYRRAILLCSNNRESLSYCA